MSSLPIPIARIAMCLMPPSRLQRATEGLIFRMRQRHPRLFKNLERLSPALVLVEVTDLPHRFLLAFGDGKTSLTVNPSEKNDCDAKISGSLAALISLLEGRVDGDKLFFSRDIEITGNTSIIVALRNTLDREEIVLLEDVTYPLGPFARPVKRAVLGLDALAQRIKSHIGNIAAERMKTPEMENLRSEVANLKEHLAKLEAATKHEGALS